MNLRQRCREEANGGSDTEAGLENGGAISACCHDLPPGTAVEALAGSLLLMLNLLAVFVGAVVFGIAVLAQLQGRLADGPGSAAVAASVCPRDQPSDHGRPAERHSQLVAAASAAARSG